MKYDYLYQIKGVEYKLICLTFNYVEVVSMHGEITTVDSATISLPSSQS